MNQPTDERTRCQDRTNSGCRSLGKPPFQFGLEVRWCQWLQSRGPKRAGTGLGCGPCTVGAATLLPPSCAFSPFCAFSRARGGVWEPSAGSFMESHKAMAEADVAKIAAASTAAADKIHNLLSASDVDTLKRQQLLMYCLCIPLSSIPALYYSSKSMKNSFFVFWRALLEDHLTWNSRFRPVGFALISIEFQGDWFLADLEGCKTATQCYLISMIFQNVALLQWPTTSPKTHACWSLWRLI